MRKRFRGNAPISTSLELEGGGGGAGLEKAGKGGQLYGGRPAFDVRESMGKGAKGEVQGLGFDESKTRGL
jgi:hypothetical protein